MTVVSSGSALLAGLFAALAVLVLWPGGSPAAGVRRLPRSRQAGPLPTRRRHGDRARASSTGSPPAEGLSARTRGATSLVGGAALALLVGGLPGLALGALAAAGLHRYLGTLRTRAALARRAQLGSDLPVAADLLAACLAAGSSLVDGVSAVADAVDGPTGAALRPVVASLRLGGDPATCWAGLEREPALAPLGRALARAAASGAPVAEVVGRLAEEQRVARRWAAEAAARRVGVLAVVPLGACFLPAFVLLGVVPVVVGSAGLVLPALR